MSGMSNSLHMLFDWSNVLAPKKSWNSAASGGSRGMFWDVGMLCTDTSLMKLFVVLLEVEALSTDYKFFERCN